MSKKKHPDIICKCGEKVKDMHYCTKCKRINFGKRKMVVVGTIKKTKSSDI